MILCNASGAGREVLVTGEQDGALRVRNVHALGQGQSVIPLEPDDPKPIRSLSAWRECDAIAAGTQTGYMTVIQLSDITEMADV